MEDMNMENICAVVGALVLLLCALGTIALLLIKISELFYGLKRYAKDVLEHQRKDKEISRLKAKIVTLETRIATLSLPKQGPYKTNGIRIDEALNEIESHLQEIEEDSQIYKSPDTAR